MRVLEHRHDRASIERRLMAGPRVSYLRDRVYGGIDGAVTTLAIVAGAVGADLPSHIVLILGVANLAGDGFSMAAGNFNATRSEREEYARLRAMEDRHIRLDPDGEREEVRQIYRAKGFSGGDLERAVAIVTADRGRWIAAMMADEHGQPAVLRSPWRAALHTFGAFLACGTVPLLPFAVGGAAQTVVALFMTALVFFGIGSVKSSWSPRSWWRSGLETLGIGMGAAGLAFLIGAIARTLI